MPQSSHAVTNLQTIDVRQASINPNHWYVVALSQEVTDRPVSVTLWQKAIVLYRDSTRCLHALEDVCPHRFVQLSQGCVVGDELECAYHGWRINAQGRCTAVPYLTDTQKLPTRQTRRYPVREQDGFIWLFPGEASLADTRSPLALPEWEHLNYIGSVATIEVNAHFSYLIENLMDMYHGHLHQNYQAWTGAVLQDLVETPDRVDAHYQAQNYYRIDKIWAISQLFLPQLRQLHPDPLDVSYVYPHWASRLGDDFTIYCLFCPIDWQRTRAYLVHFTSLHAFFRLHRLPIGVRRWVKNRCFNSARPLLQGLIRQDVQMIEQEQQAYLAQPDRRPHEFNRALAGVQRLIRTQAAIDPSADPVKETGKPLERA
jgi:phenylpropionate dioxygenase-like ring-hydroxylating dioxygenase large terminal subunit